MKGAIALLVRGAGFTNAAGAITDGANPLDASVGAEIDGAGGLSSYANVTELLAGLLSGSGGVSGDSNPVVGPSGHSFFGLGEVDGVASISGAIMVTAAVGAQADAAGSISGSSSIAAAARGEVDGAAGASGRANTIEGFAGAIAGAAALTGDVQLNHLSYAFGTLGAVGSILAAPVVAVRMAGRLDPSSDFTDEFTDEFGDPAHMFGSISLRSGSIGARFDGSGGSSSSTNAFIGFSGEVDAAGGLSGAIAILQGQGGTLWGAQGRIDGAGGLSAAPVVANRGGISNETDAVAAISGSIIIGTSALARVGAVGGISGNALRVPFSSVAESDAVANITAGAQVAVKAGAIIGGTASIAAAIIDARPMGGEIDSSGGIIGRLAPISFASASSAGSGAITGNPLVNGVSGATGAIGLLAIGTGGIGVTNNPMSVRFAVGGLIGSTPVLSGRFILRAKLIGAPIGALAGISGDVVLALPPQEFTDEFTEEFTSGPATWPLAGLISGGAHISGTLTFAEFTDEFSNEFTTSG